jgi:hypothetical protein
VKGLMTGLTRGTTKAHIARATLEALALQNVDILGAMERDLLRRLKSLRVDGGATKNSYGNPLNASCQRSQEDKQEPGFLRGNELLKEHSFSYRQNSYCLNLRRHDCSIVEKNFNSFEFSGLFFVKLFDISCLVETFR